jgi:hypothetical protein
MARLVNPMCGFLVEELRESQGSVTRSMVEQEGNGVAEDLPQQPASQVPEVPGPYPLYAIAPRELREDGINAVTKAAQEGAPLGSRVLLLCPVRREELDAHATRQLFLGLGRPVIAIPDDETRGSLDDLWQHGELMGISRGHREAGNETRPANPNMHPEAVEGLPEKRVLAESRLAAKALAPVSAGEEAGRQGHRVADGEGGIVRGEREELLPEALLYLPEVCCLPAEGGAMHSPQVREVVGVVVPEVGKELRVLIESQELSDDLDGEHFGIGECGGGSTCSEASEVLDAIVYEAEDRDDEGVKIHESGDSFLLR